MKKASDLDYDGVPSIKISLKILAKAILRKFYLKPKKQVEHSLNKIHWIPKERAIERKIAKITQQKLEGDNKIPKILHYIWVGGSKKPESVEKYIATWKKYCPDYEIIEWNEENYNIKKNRYAREAYEAKKWAFVTDYMRLDILDRFGGIYLDSDVEVLKSLDVFLRDPAFTSFEAGNPDQIMLPTGLMASAKGNEWIKYLKTYYNKGRSFYLANGQMDSETTNTLTITRMTVSKYGVKLNDKLQKNEDFTLYPHDYFCPKSWATRKINLTKNSHAIHHFSGSWLPKNIRDQQHKSEQEG